MTSNDSNLNHDALADTMANRLVSVRLTDSLLKEVRTVAQAEGCKNVQEFMRETLRDAVLRRKLDAAYRSEKPGKPASKAEQERLALPFSPPLTTEELEGVVRMLYGSQAHLKHKLKNYKAVREEAVKDFYKQNGWEYKPYLKEPTNKKKSLQRS